MGQLLWFGEQSEDMDESVRRFLLQAETSVNRFVKSGLASAVVAYSIDVKIFATNDAAPE